MAKDIITQTVPSDKGTDAKCLGELLLKVIGS